MSAQTKEITKRKPKRADTSRAAIEQRDMEILGAIADGGSSSGFIAEGTQINRRTVQYRLMQLRKEGLVGDSSRGTFRLTGAGQAQVFARRQPMIVAESDPSVLERLPAEHQAMLRLVSDAIIARRAFAELHPGNWPGFVVLGPSKTGKTLIAQLVCRRFGLNPTVHIRALPRETAGSIWGRRVAETGGGWRFEPTALLAGPFAALDEFDKASPDVRRAAHAYLQGDSEFAAEDERAAVRATPLVLLNQDQGVEILPEPYQRRSVLLDTSGLLEATADIDEVARTVLIAPLPKISDSLVPPAAVIPEPAHLLFRSALQSCLSRRGWRRADVVSLERIVLGRWAANPQAGAERAALAVAADYLLCTSTRADEVTDDWPARLDAVASALAGGAGAVATVRPRRRTEREFREVERLRAEEARAAIAGKREELLAGISHALAHSPRGLGEAAAVQVAGARGRARSRREQIREADTLEDLTRLSEIVEREVLMPLREVGRDHTAAAEAAAAAKQTAAAEKRAASNQRRVQREREKQIDAFIRGLQVLYLKTDLTYDPAVLNDLVRLGCVEARTSTYEEETVRSKLRRVGRRVGQGVSRFLGPTATAPAQTDLLGDLNVYLRQYAPPAAAPDDDREYETKTSTWYIDQSGTHYTALELASWGSPSVKALLRTAAGRYQRALRPPRHAAVAANTATRSSSSTRRAGPRKTTRPTALVRRPESGSAKLTPGPRSRAQ